MSSHSSSPLQSPREVVPNDSELLSDGSATSIEVELHHRPSEVLVTDAGGDYPAAHGFHDVINICYLESKKSWAIAAPIAFNILCNYGINSFTNIFVGHIGDVELSAVAISLSVIANFSFGFLVCFFTNYLYFLVSILFFPVHSCNKFKLQVTPYKV